MAGAAVSTADQFQKVAALTDRLLGREWQRDDGAAMKIGRCLIDANWGHSTDVVYQFYRQSPHASILLPSHGRFVGASSIRTKARAC